MQENPRFDESFPSGRKENRCLVTSNSARREGEKFISRVILLVPLFAFPQICNAAINFGDLFTMPGVTPEQQITLILWGIGGSFVALVVAGMTNRVVVFADGKDLLWTVCIFLIPTIAFLIAATLVPEGQEVLDDSLSSIVVGIGGVLGLISCVMAFVLSIKHNGLFLGVIVGIFKVMAAVLAAICAIGLVGKIFDKESGSSAERMFALVIFGVLLWMMSKLINGDEVYERRADLSS